MSMQKILLSVPLWILLALPLTAVPSAPAVLSDLASISVLTMGPGREIYLAFGHSALRVQDPLQGMDLVFNYGTFSVDDPLFIPRFIRGELNYRLDVYPSTMAYLDFDIKYQNRLWIEQELDLTAAQKQAMYRFLIHNALPENRFYIYDFLKDNCSTRITDALSHVLGENLRLKPALDSPRSYRNLLDEYAEKRPFWNFLFALGVGSAADRSMASLEEDWLPFYLLYILDRSEVVRDGETRPLVKKKHILFQPEPASDYSAPWSEPGYVLWPLAFLVLILSLRGFIRKSPLSVPERAGDLILFTAVGLLGSLLFYLNFFSIHTAAKENWNLVWANPLALACVLALAGKRPAGWKQWVFLPPVLGSAAVLFLWPWWPQAMPLSFLPVQGMVLVRSLRRFLEKPPLLKK